MSYPVKLRASTGCLFFTLSVALTGPVTDPVGNSSTAVRHSIPQDVTKSAAQAQLSRDDDDQTHFANAHPFVDERLENLGKKIPELRKLKPASDQQILPKILEKTAANVDGFFRDIVDLIAEENISEERSTSFGSSRARVRDSYLIVRGGDDAPSDVLEYRMDDAGKRIDRMLPPGYLVTSGFALISNYLSAAAQPESRFRYLGDQKLGSRDTYVIAFAQVPGRATQFITMAGPHGNSGDMLVQGIAWIAQDNFQIVRLRTDLLAPRPEIIRQTTDVNFAEVSFQDIANPLWLPSQVKVYLTVKEAGALYERQFHNEHRYTNYRRYRVSVKIGPPN
jgi:hypothetical protein